MCACCCRYPLSNLKGTVSQYFQLLVFFMNQFPPSIWVYHYSNSKIGGNIRGSRCTTGVNDTSGKWKKTSSRKILIIWFEHLWVVELTYIYIFAFKFTWRCLQPDIVLIICHRCRWHRWCTMTCEYLREFSKKFETILIGYSGAGGKLIHKKTRSKKSRDTVPLSWQ